MPALHPKVKIHIQYTKDDTQENISKLEINVLITHGLFLKIPIS